MKTAPMCVRWLGRKPYEEVWRLQRELVSTIAAGESPETLLLVEHDPVLTIGRKQGAAAHVLAPGGWPVFEVERGGDATYHGPGQLVGYPLLRLEGHERDLHRYLRALEEWLILTLGDFGLAAARKPGLTGVWADNRKLASLGVAVKRWVTYHGFGLNVGTALADFGRLRPCGLDGGVMASMESLLGRPVPMAAVIDCLLAHAPAALGREGRR